MKTLVRAAVVLVAAAPAVAHDFWIEPATFAPAAGAQVGLGLRVGEAFRGEPLPRIPPYIERFVVRGPSGETVVAGRPGSDPAGLLAVEPGFQVVLYQSRPYPMDIAGPTFDRYVNEEGLDAAKALRAQRGETGQPTRERFSRCAKLLLRAAGSTARGADVAFGCPHELVADEDPTVAQSGMVALRVLHGGKPQAGALVVARHQATPAEAVRARTDTAGRVRLALPRGGVWIVKSIHLQPAPPGSGVAWESFWASLVFEARPR